MLLRFLLMVFCLGSADVMAEQPLILDDRTTPNLESALGTSWRMVTDGVMGGVSSGTLTTAAIDDRDCLRMQGDVRLENNGGFVQAALQLEDTAAEDASGYSGVAIDVYGNNESYNLHLRTDDLWLPWQSYRASFQATDSWQTVRLPFAEFVPYKTSKALDLTELERLGVVAIGRAFSADVCIGRLEFY